MASYQDLLDAVARVRVATGDADAWMAGLSGEELALVSSPLSVVAPGAIDSVLARIRARHPAVFDQPAPAEGHTAEAIRAAETSLAQQNSMSAQVDLQVITAVLNAHATHAAGRAALEDLQNEIESAVSSRSDLNTPAGARGFQRYLIDKLRDIRMVVDTAGLDATSKAALAAALASLYAAATPVAPATADGPAPESRSEPTPARPSPPPDEPSPTPVGEAAADPLLDQLLAEDPGTASPDPSAQSAPTAVPMAPAVPSIPSMPAFGGAGLPTGVPSGAGLMPPPSLNPHAAADPIDPTEDLLADGPSDPRTDSGPADDEPATDETDPAPTEDPTVVHLPDGETVTAPSPELAAAITAAVAGTPVAEAYRQQGITIPAPGTPVPVPIDPARLIAGDVGMLTDRHAVALGNGKAVFNGKIEPISSVTGPSFLGWEHPPEPGSSAPPPKSERPTPTRPAVTAGPS